MEQPSSFADRIKNMHSKELYDFLAEEMNEVLKIMISENRVPTPEEPIEFENEKGRFKYDGNGTFYVEPKKGIEKIKVDITIKPSNYNENNSK
jgi:hypothetical protein